MKAVQWTGHEDNMWSPCPHTAPNLLPAIYDMNWTPMGWFLNAKQPKHDNIIKLGVAEYVFDNITKFRASKKQYEALGLLHKRGFLLWGPPGTGKSIALQLIANDAINNKGVVLICQDPNLAVTVISVIRSIHPNLDITCLWEDIEQVCDEYDEVDRAVMTNLLDGQTQIDNVVHIATTNNFDQIGEAFANRPGRFDDVIYVGAPEESVRLAYLKNMLPKGEPRLIEELARKSDGMHLSHIKDTIVSVFVLGHSVDATIERMKKMTEVRETIIKDKKNRETDAKMAKQLKGLFGSKR